MGKKAAAAHEDKVAYYEALVATQPDVERRGATTPYTSVNGNMFSFLTKEGALALRLDAEAREAFLKKHKTNLCEQHGVVMKEYVEVPDALLANTKKLKADFAASYQYACSLKAKPTTRKKSKPAKKKAARKKTTAKVVGTKTSSKKKTAKHQTAKKKKTAPRKKRAPKRPAKKYAKKKAAKKKRP